MLTLLITGAFAQSPPPVTFASNYGDHMVLQQAPQQAIVWGYCGGGGKPAHGALGFRNKSNNTLAALTVFTSTTCH
jgi:hypothetical protein